MPRLEGIFAAAATPLKPDYGIDEERLVRHCRWLLGEGGCDGVNLLGTTGEATSFSVAERLSAMRAVAEAGLPMTRFMVGTGAAAMQDAITLTRAARELGFSGALLLPPFYYKGISEEALEAYVSKVIESACEGDFGLYLYHIPQMSAVPYSIPLVQKLAARFPGTLAGIKDSTGNLENSGRSPNRCRRSRCSPAPKPCSPRRRRSSSRAASPAPPTSPAPRRRAAGARAAPRRDGKPSSRRWRCARRSRNSR